MGYGEWDGASVRNTQVAARRAYAEAGLSDPRTDLSLTEVHDCFSITELVTMEDLGLSNPGRAAFDILDGRFARAGAVPCPTAGGLKCFGQDRASAVSGKSVYISVVLLGSRIIK